MPGTSTKAPGAALAALAGVFVLLYREVFIDLVRNWLRDPNYSHGFVILPIVGYLVYERRNRLQATPAVPSNAGLIVIALSAAALLVGTAGVEFFLMRASAVSMAAGIVLYLYGWRRLRVLAFPLAFLLLMIPIPAIVFYPIAFKLQLIATKFGVAVLNVGGIPVLREGNVIVLEKATLEVAEACSGIRSLVTLFTLSLLYGYFTTTGRLQRCLTALASVPIAIVANGLRVAATGLAVQYIGPQMAAGAIHSVWGGAVFVASLGMLVVAVKLIEAGRRPLRAKARTA